MDGSSLLSISSRHAPCTPPRRHQRLSCGRKYYGIPGGEGSELLLFSFPAPLRTSSIPSPSLNPPHHHRSSAGSSPSRPAASPSAAARRAPLGSSAGLSLGSVWPTPWRPPLGAPPGHARRSPHRGVRRARVGRGLAWGKRPLCGGREPATSSWLNTRSLSLTLCVCA